MPPKADRRTPFLSHRPHWLPLRSVCLASPRPVYFSTLAAFGGTVDEFRAKLADEHGDNDHAKEYEMALLMIEAAAIWTPKEEA